jgi:hypothetical protein
VLGDIRGGQRSATMTLNLMSIVADSVERAVLFVKRRDSLLCVDAFGSTADGRPLAQLTRGLVLACAGDDELGRAVIDGRAHAVTREALLARGAFTSLVDAPRSGQAVLFPVMGARKVVALIYGDNGRRSSPVADLEIIELAAAQAGLAFENELLRRQIDKRVSGGDGAGSIKEPT